MSSVRPNVRYYFGGDLAEAKKASSIRFSRPLNKLPPDIEAKLEEALAGDVADFKMLSRQLGIPVKTIRNHADKRSVKNIGQKNQVSSDKSDAISAELQTGNKSFNQIASSLGVSTNAVRSRAKKKKIKSLAKSGTPLPPEKYFELDVFLEKGLRTFEICREAGISRNTVVKRKNDLLEKYRLLDINEIHARLSAILELVLAEEPKIIASKNLRVNPIHLDLILKGLAELPIGVKTREWINVFETRYSQNRQWQNHKTEFVQLITYAQQSPCQMTHKKLPTKNSRQPKNLSEILNLLEVADIAGAVQLARVQHNDTPEQLVAKMKDPDINVPLLGAVESNNQNVARDRFIQAAEGTCRVYGQEDWLCALAKRLEKPDSSKQRKRIEAIMHLIAA